MKKIPKKRNPSQEQEKDLLLQSITFKIRRLYESSETFSLSVSKLKEINKKLDEIYKIFIM